jgi:ATP-dependent DNA helicase RecQ
MTGRVTIVHNDRSVTTDDELYGTLRRVFGFQGFRPDQETVVRAILDGKDVLAVMPTGGGKSLCYQLPAVLRSGTCMVISPLVSLMKDQVDGARENGIRAAYLNSTLCAEERSVVLQTMFSDSLDLLYVSPERFALAQFQEMICRLNITMAVIDEAHCISEWGHDFRPDYLSLSAITRILPGIPVAAFTATATSGVQQDILNKLGLRDPLVIRASFDRPNLSYEVHFKDNTDGQLAAILKNNSDKAGIIYRTSRKSVNDTAAMLRKKGFRVLPYHAGLGEDERKRNQEAFIRDEADVVVATVAFGMGIDKSNIRFVVHADLPVSIEHYYQETGRAGRDGEDASCILLYAQSDVPRVRFFIDSILDEHERARALVSLSKVIAYASATVCRRRALLDYFGETYPRENCGSCDVCNGSKELSDFTTESRMLLSAMVRTGERFGASHLVDILLGSANKKIRDSGHDRLGVYGAGKANDRKFWRRLIDDLLARKVIAKSEGLYPALYLLPKAVRILRNEEKVEMVRIVGKKTVRANKKEQNGASTDRELFELLRALRKQIADEQGVPPYIVFSDRTLHEMTARLPENSDALLSIPGVGDAKLARYGRQFLLLIDRYCSEHPDTVCRTVHVS